MTSRDLLQRRSTNSRGETVWQDTQLVRACKHGGVCVVDGVERLSEGLLSSLQRLCVDRELSLYDGGLLLHPARFDAACWAP